MPPSDGGSPSGYAPSGALSMGKGTSLVAASSEEHADAAATTRTSTNAADRRGCMRSWSDTPRDGGKLAPG